MNTFTLLGAAGLAASLVAGPAFAQNGGANGNLNNPTSYSNGRSFGHEANSGSNSTNNPGFTSNTKNVVGNGKYANIGSGGYAANQTFIRNGNNNGNNGNNNNNGNENWRISQRNSTLADNGDARASKVIGTGVFNANNQQLGSVDDILIGSNGVFAVISTNNKKVAVPFNQLKFGNATNEGNDKIVLPDQTQAHLNTMPVFHYDITNYQGSKANVTANNNNGTGRLGNNNAGWNGNGGGPFSGNNNRGAGNNHNNG